MDDKAASLKFWGIMALVLGLSILLITGISVSQSCAWGFAHAEIRKGAAAGCAEFWFNRYQTTIAALGALLAASVAAWPVWR